jgi:transcriptional antiterminator RfaH
MHQQFRVFRPLMRQQKRCRGRISVVIESLFPRYLFVELDRVEDNWAPIRSTRGVVGLVRTGDRIVSAPKRMIDELKARVGEDGTVALDREKDYRANQRTRVIDGPFAGFEALFLERRGEDRVLVMLNMMQQAQRLVLPDYCIEAA